MLRCLAIGRYEERRPAHRGLRAMPCACESFDEGERRLGCDGCHLMPDCCRCYLHELEGIHKHDLFVHRLYKLVVFHRTIDHEAVSFVARSIRSERLPHDDVRKSKAVSRTLTLRVRQSAQPVLDFRCGRRGLDHGAEEPPEPVPWVVGPSIGALVISSGDGMNDAIGQKTRDGWEGT
jgi:hypothetical protein